MEVFSPTSYSKRDQVDPATMSLAGGWFQLPETWRQGKLLSVVLERVYVGENCHRQMASLLCLRLLAYD